VIRDRGQLVDLLYERVMPGTGPIPHDLVQQVKDQYDTALANLDEHVGALLDKLRTMGLYDETMIVVTSDHGEYFGEHHLVEHSKDVYEEAMWIPLIIKNPGQQTGGVETILTSSTDIPNLIFSQFPRDTADRYTSVYSDAPGNHFVISENYYTRVKDLFHEQWGHRFQRVRTVVYDWPYKYIHSSDGNHELYDLSSDPGETNSLNVLQPKLAAQLAALLQDVRNRRTSWNDPSAPPPLSEEQIRNLRSLGYVR
jgi:arylsulfatase A-like enzyme